MGTEYLLKVKDKINLESIEKFAEVSYVSIYMDVIIVSVKDENLRCLDTDDNIVSYEKDRVGSYNV